MLSLLISRRSNLAELKQMNAALPGLLAPRRALSPSGFPLLPFAWSQLTFFEPIVCVSVQSTGDSGYTDVATMVPALENSQ